MPQHVVLLSIPGLRERDLSSMPNLGRLATGGGYATLVPSFPAVTCPVQANMTTGMRPREHGVVANGFYWRDQRRVEMWTAWNDCIQRPQIWDILHDRDRSITSAVWFPLHSKGCGADLHLHARAGPQPRRQRIALVLHAARDAVRRAEDQDRATSRCSIFGGRSPEFNRRPGSSTPRSMPPESIGPTSSTSTCRTSTTPPRRAGPTARPPSSRWPSWTPRSESWSPASRRPTASRRCGWWPAST